MKVIISGDINVGKSSILRRCYSDKELTEKGLCLAKERAFYYRQMSAKAEDDFAMRSLDKFTVDCLLKKIREKSLSSLQTINCDGDYDDNKCCNL